jgi:Transketolase, C-terminal domain
MRLVPEPRPLQVGRPFRIAQIADGLNERLPIIAGAGRRRDIAKGHDRIRGLRHVIEHALRGCGADAGQKMQQPEAGNAVTGIFDEAQERQHVLDVRGVEKLQPAELHERNVAAGQFDFERSAVARCPEQHRLLLQQRPRFAVFENAFDDAAALVGLVTAEGGERKLTILSTGSELHLAVEARDLLQKEGIPTAVVSMPCRLLFEDQDPTYKKEVLGTTRARVAIEAAVELGWERYSGLEGRFVGMHSFGASGKIADVYKKFDINAEAVVRAAHETLAEVAAI